MCLSTTVVIHPLNAFVTVLSTCVGAGGKLSALHSGIISYDVCGLPAAHEPDSCAPPFDVGTQRK